MNRLIELLSKPGVHIADGATGTMLQDAGLPPGSAPDAWNLENPDAIRALHQSYIDSGSEIILTNTFGGHPVRLAMAKMADQVHEANLAAAQLAREVAGDTVVVLGDLGPTGELLVPLGSLTFEDAKQGFFQQATALAEGGVDGILIETMSDLQEMQAAVEGVQEACDLPILATMSFDTSGRTMMGVKPEVAAEKLSAMGADVVGANCGRTLTENLEAITRMRETAPDLTLIAKPNAGLPQYEQGNLVYDVTPDVMAEYAQKFAALGVRIFGGCCGSTPAHIRAVADALKEDR